MKEILNNNEKGITLIALVITIIVLLLLAGVSISMLSGENGILKQTNEAKTKNEDATTDEQVKLAAMTSLISSEGTVNLQVLNEELGKIGFDRGTPVDGIYPNDIKEEDFPATVTISGKDYIINKNGTIGVKTITASKYGELTNYKVDIDGDGEYNDWQLFYDDGVNVYLIAKDYVQLDDETKNATGMSTNGYYAWWDSPTYPSTTTNVITKYEKFNGLLTNGYNSAKCVTQLLNETNWTAYKDNEGKAEYVIGGPTIELFAKSYNEKHPSKTIEYNNYTYGYKLKWNVDIYYNATVSGLEKSDGIYVITESSNDTGKCNGYWLASPANGATGANNYLFSVNYIGNVACGSSNGKNSDRNSSYSLSKINSTI